MNKAVSVAKPTPANWLVGGGEMGERIRAFDWASTPLGPADNWPEALKSAVTFCLGSAFPIVIWWDAKDTAVQFYNDAYISFLGPVKHPASLGQSGRVCWREIWDTMGPLWEKVLEQGEACWCEDFHYAINRKLPLEEGYFTFSYSPIYGPSGTVDGIFCACYETTAKVVGARRLETLRKLGEKLVDAHSIVDTCTNAEAVLGENSYDIPCVRIYLTDANGKLPHDCIAPAALEAVLTTQQPRELNDLQLVGGAWPQPATHALVFPLWCSTQERVVGVILLAVSPRRPLDDEYQTFFKLIATQVSTALTNAHAREEEHKRAEALAEIDRAKTVFFSNISHEFRTPLTLMLGPIDDALAETGAGAQRERLELLRRNALRLQKLVNSLLDFSRIEAGRIQANYEPTALAEFTRELASVFRAATDKAGLQLIIDCEPLDEPVFVDRDMYEKIVLNLISNAFKFTLEGEIEIRLRDAGAAVELVVRDTGCGIDSEQLPQIFQRFHRVEGVRARTQEGTGIGLALVQELVRLHGGAIAVHSAVNAGSTFTVTLPKGMRHLQADQIGVVREAKPAAIVDNYFSQEALRWLPDQSAASEQISAADDSSEVGGGLASKSEPARARIIWADDNADMRDYVGRLLRPFYDVEAVPDGEAALAALHRQPADLVLADVMMPKLDGFGLLRKLRSDARTHTTPVILLSARAGEEAQVGGIQAGADDYLIKPFSARELLARIDARIEMTKLRRHAETKLHDSEKRLRTIIEHLPAGIGVMDMNGKWTLSNSMMARYVPEAIPSSLAQRIPSWRGWDKRGEPIPPSQWPGARALRGEFVIPGMEMLHTSSDGQKYWLRVSAAPLRDDAGNLVGGCVVAQDITQLQNVEQALREADRRKDEFLATLAHELRNPLAPIRNGLHILRLTGNRSAEVDQVQAMIERQVTHMIRLVDDLMEISRVNGGKIELRKERIDIAAVLRSAMEISEPLIGAAHHRLEIELPTAPLIVHADPIRLAQVVANLLNNAAKYTEENGRIWLAARREGANAVISVRDNGVGIPAEMLPKIFDLFTQVERSYKRVQGGLGIGLTLVRSLVEMHGGGVEAKSEGSGRGSEFLVRLPALEPMNMAAHDHAAREQTAALPRRVLVVDDNRDAADTLGKILELLGTGVCIANDGATALASIASYRPDVVLLDIGMPGMDGYEAARRMRQQAGGRDLKLIAITGWGQEEDRRRSSDAGIDYHLVKPVDVRMLKQLLASMAKENNS